MPFFRKNEGVANLLDYVADQFTAGRVSGKRPEDNDDEIAENFRCQAEAQRDPTIPTKDRFIVLYNEFVECVNVAIGASQLDGSKGIPKEMLKDIAERFVTTFPDAEVILDSFIVHIRGDQADIVPVERGRGYLSQIRAM